MPRKSKPDHSEFYAHYQSLQGEAAFKARTEHGMLAVIDICDHPFFVDTRLGQLRPKDNFLSPGLDIFNGGYWNDRDRCYLFCYDKKEQAEAFFSPDPTELPKDVVVIKVPSLYVLDPVGCARLEGKDERAYLKEFPIKMFHQAQTMPLTADNLKLITGIWMDEPAKQLPPAAKVIKHRQVPRGRHL